MSVVAAVVSSDSIILVEGEHNTDGTVTISKDETLDLEEGPRHKAYAVMAKRVKDRLGVGVETLVLKASSGGQYAAKTAILHAAELRGVFLSAIPPQIEVIQRQKKTISKGRSRKMDDYIKDDAFFADNVYGAKLRKGSREAAFLIFNEGSD